MHLIPHPPPQSPQPMNKPVVTEALNTMGGRKKYIYRLAAGHLIWTEPPQLGPPLASHAADPASAPWWSTAARVTLARGALPLSRWPFLSVQLAATTGPRVQSPGCSQALCLAPCLPIATASCRAWHTEGLSPACWGLHSGHQTPPHRVLPCAAGLPGLGSKG